MNYIFSGYEGAAPDEKSQHGLLLVFYSFSVLLEILFSYINYMHGLQLLSLTQMISAVVLIPWLLTGLKQRWLPYPREVLLSTLFIVLGLLIIDGGIGNTGIYWAQIFPFAAFMLMGVRLGWYWCGAFTLFYASLLLLHGLKVIDFTYHHDTLSFAPTMFLVFAAIAFLFQRQQERRQFHLNGVNKRLKESEQNLKESKADLEHVVQLRTLQLQQINEKLSREVDEKIKAIQQFELAEMKYQHAQKMDALGTLVGGIAHDFNNMLSGISANLYLLQRKVEAPDLKKRIDKIGDLTMHAADMIRQLMTFARKDDVQLKVFDLSLYIKEAYKLAKISIPADIRCECQFPQEDQMIRGEATQIQQILMNLMNNARDALKGVEAPFISVSLTPSRVDQSITKNQQEILPGNYTILSVQDNGCGMSDSEVSHIFEPFYTTKEIGSGTGLGLAMVYGAVHSHGGYIDVVSYPESGTRFSIYFPIVDEQEEAHPINSVIEEGRQETILLVDDDESLLEANEQLLVELGYQVMTAKNGFQALDIYRHRGETIDLVLMDVVMPVLGGPAAAEQIRKINPDVKILFVTGYDRDHQSTCEMVSEWESVLNKPLIVDELCRAIRDKLS
ncbi:ATP-binding protein [Mariprofundus sp. KV]|uniref:hybrid sensor histidine kinase/response regulator n=1 Tax=Mariprofundus sp. KV TaxID=2608715 RepID=UPI0015A18EC0|nr:ATP-binding protein [Mariprofundus sp. KV]NWF35665.1 response regulator [Mariprofundus sp. KV]